MTTFNKLEEIRSKVGDNAFYEIGNKPFYDGIPMSGTIGDLCAASLKVVTELAQTYKCDGESLDDLIICLERIELLFSSITVYGKDIIIFMEGDYDSCNNIYKEFDTTKCK